jgi:hypothetical protein
MTARMCVSERESGRMMRAHVMYSTCGGTESVVKARAFCLTKIKLSVLRNGPTYLAEENRWKMSARLALVIVHN